MITWWVRGGGGHVEHQEGVAPSLTLSFSLSPGLYILPCSPTNNILLFILLFISFSGSQCQDSSQVPYLYLSQFIPPPSLFHSLPQVLCNDEVDWNTPKCLFVLAILPPTAAVANKHIIHRRDIGENRVRERERKGRTDRQTDSVGGK